LLLKLLKGYLLGYDSNTKAYKVFNKSSRCIEVSCDVVFDRTNGSQRGQVDCWGPSASEGPQKQDLTVFL
jgi:hypothetical protein